MHCAYRGRLKIGKTTLFLALLSSFGCHSAPYIWVHNLPPEPPQPAATKIAAGDIVEVRVFGQDNLSTRGQVRGDGLMALPLIGQVPFAGYKPEEVALAIKSRLTPYVNTPEVTVVVQQSQVRISLIGEVKQVGIIDLESPATVLQALAKAGGITEFADASSIYVLRTSGANTMRIRFHYDSLIEAKPLALGFHLKTGDVIVVE